MPVSVVWNEHLGGTGILPVSMLNPRVNKHFSHCSRFPIPDSRFPIPIPDSRFPIPDSRFPIPCSLLRDPTL
ncbi:hypothetical protein [Moorena producens]|uniref:hypothetical protein n=1 Tax=Moorena producens TaxID=1155739 RepID=UPI003C782B3A